MEGGNKKELDERKEKLKKAGLALAGIGSLTFLLKDAKTSCSGECDKSCMLGCPTCAPGGSNQQMK